MADIPISKPAEFTRGAAIKKEPEAVEFKKGEKVAESIPSSKQPEIIRGSAFKKEAETVDFKRGEALSKQPEIARGGAVKKEAEQGEFKRGEKIIDITSTPSKVEISRGIASTKKEPEKEIKTEEFVRGGALPKKEPEREVKKEEYVRGGARADDFVRGGAKKEELATKKEIKPEPQTTKQAECDSGFSRGTRTFKEEPKKDDGFGRSKVQPTTTTTKGKEPEKKATDDKWDRGARNNNK